jgi:hypothetical protein
MKPREIATNVMIPSSPRTKILAVSTSLVAAASLLYSGQASAQNIGTSRWDRADRPRYESPQNFAVEVRFGPYRPEVDESFGGNGPYTKAFGTGKSVYFGLELDWQALRIPWVGTFGPGISWGTTSKSNAAKISKSTKDSAEDTYFSVQPMYGVGVLRIDVLAREVGIPIVPYGKFGLGYALWSTGTDAGVSTRDGVLGKGHTWGTHLALGGSVLLDFIDTSAAAQADEDTGINNSYIFLEWMRNNLDGMIESKPQMHVGTSTWVLGLAVEL